MSKLFKSICSVLFVMVFVSALSFSTLQADEKDHNCDKPCGSEKCNMKTSACCLAKQAKQAKQLSTAKSSADQVVLNIKGMTCGGCEGRVQSALTKCPGVKDAQVSQKDGKAVVHVESGKANIKALIKAVESVGFTASKG